MSRRWAIRTFVLGVVLSLAGQFPDSAASETPFAGSFQNGRNGSRIESAIQILERVPTGHALLEKASKIWNLGASEGILAHLKPGVTSRTDAVLTRHYNPNTGEESREREVVIYVRQDQSLINMVLDIAHEMTHATSRPSWDPYDPELTAGMYIRNAIEGQGGEVQAVQTECQVSLELATQYDFKIRRCRDYLTQDHQHIDSDRIRSDFYRVGKWDSELNKTLGKEAKMFPRLSSAPPRLYSSTGNAPYPAALLQEFQALTKIACENSKRRADSLRERSIASLNGGNTRASADPTFRFIERRCQ